MIFDVWNDAQKFICGVVYDLTKALVTILNLQHSFSWKSYCEIELVTSHAHTTEHYTLPLFRFEYKIRVGTVLMNPHPDSSFAIGFWEVDGSSFIFCLHVFLKGIVHHSRAVKDRDPSPNKSQVFLFCLKYCLSASASLVRMRSKNSVKREILRGLGYSAISGSIHLRAIVSYLDAWVICSDQPSSKKPVISRPRWVYEQVNYRYLRTNRGQLEEKCFGNVFGPPRLTPQSSLVWHFFGVMTH